MSTMTNFRKQYKNRQPQRRKNRYALCKHYSCNVRFRNTQTRDAKQTFLSVSSAYMKYIKQTQTAPTQPNDKSTMTNAFKRVNTMMKLHIRDIYAIIEQIDFIIDVKKCHRNTSGNASCIEREPYLVKLRHWILDR